MSFKKNKLPPLSSFVFQNQQPLTEHGEKFFSEKSGWDTCGQVVENFFICSLNVLEEVVANALLTEKKVHVISFYGEFEHERVNCIKHIIADDNSSVNDMEEFIKVHVPIVIEWLSRGEIVIVHCQMGISRSVTFGIAVLMKLGVVMKFFEGIDFIIKTRLNTILTKYEVSSIEELSTKLNFPLYKLKNKIPTNANPNGAFSAMLMKYNNEFSFF
jgi:hypothetical protein